MVRSGQQQYASIPKMKHCVCILSKTIGYLVSVLQVFYKSCVQIVSTTFDMLKASNNSSPHFCCMLAAKS